MLQKVKFAPGFNKQVTSTGGESQWVDGDNVRFRYGTPEKIGGWSQLGSVQITGRTTAIHHFVIHQVLSMQFLVQIEYYTLILVVYVMIYIQLKRQQL